MAQCFLVPVNVLPLVFLWDILAVELDYISRPIDRVLIRDLSSGKWGFLLASYAEWVCSRLHPESSMVEQRFVFSDTRCLEIHWIKYNYYVSSRQQLKLLRQQGTGMITWSYCQTWKLTNRAWLLVDCSLSACCASCSSESFTAGRSGCFLDFWPVDPPDLSLVSAGPSVCGKS